MSTPTITYVYCQSLMIIGVLNIHELWHLNNEQFPQSLVLLWVVHKKPLILNQSSIYHPHIIHNPAIIYSQYMTSICIKYVYTDLS